MNLNEFRKLHKTMCDPIIKSFDVNTLPSATDPTQDMPVSAIQFGLNGEPINVKINKGLAYNNRPIEHMSSIDRRNNDAFDSVGELRALEAKNAGKKEINYKKESSKLEKK